MVSQALIDAVENFANDAARAAIARRPRKGDLIDLAAQWTLIAGQVPQAKRADDITSAFEMVEHFGPDHGRGVFEAVAKFALWFEGWSFAR